MKKLVGVLLVALLVFLIYYGIKLDIDNIKVQKEVDMNSVSYNGWLKVSGTKLLNKDNQEIQLRGISTHGIQWFDKLYTYHNMKKLKEDWNINVFRIAMYTAPEQEGYVKDKELKHKVIEMIEYAKRLDMYVIIDWHILGDNNPNQYKSAALEFFDELSFIYKDTPNVIFEICNEPSGDVTWKNDVKEYAQDVINIIRANSPNSLIIIGIPEWCKDLENVSKEPLEVENIMYSVHFYAGTDDRILKAKMSDFLDKNLPIFVSECGITDATGDGKIYEDKFRSWIDFLNEKNISWIFWSFSNKDEGSSLLTKDYKVTKETMKIDKYNIPSVNIEIDFEDYLSETGKILKDILLSYPKDKNK